MAGPTVVWAWPASLPQLGSQGDNAWFSCNRTRIFALGTPTEAVGLFMQTAHGRV